MAFLLWLVPSRIRHATPCRILVLRHYMPCPRDHTYEHFRSDSIFHQPLLCGCTRSTYWAELLPSYPTGLCRYEGPNLCAERPVTCIHSSDCLSSSVCNLMRRCSIHLLPRADGARRSPLIYPANRIRSDGQPRHIRCDKGCSTDSGLWCWEAITPALSHDVLSQRWGWRGVFS